MQKIGYKELVINASAPVNSFYPVELYDTVTSTWIPGTDTAAAAATSTKLRIAGYGEFFKSSITGFSLTRGANSAVQKTTIEVGTNALSGAVTVETELRIAILVKDFGYSAESARNQLQYGSDNYFQVIAVPGDTIKEVLWKLHHYGIDFQYRRYPNSVLVSKLINSVTPGVPPVTAADVTSIEIEINPNHGHREEVSFTVGVTEPAIFSGTSYLWPVVTTIVVPSAPGTNTLKYMRENIVLPTEDTSLPFQDYLSDQIAIFPLYSGLSFSIKNESDGSGLSARGQILETAASFDVYSVDTAVAQVNTITSVITKFLEASPAPASKRYLKNAAGTITGLTPTTFLA